jgi:hypothetical protein
VLRMSRTDRTRGAGDPRLAAVGPGDEAGTDLDDGPNGGRHPRAVIFGLAALLAAGAAVFAALHKRQSPSGDPWAVAAEDYPDLATPYTPPAPAHRADEPTTEKPTTEEVEPVEES